jgi:hypothetical protein
MLVAREPELTLISGRMRAENRKGNYSLTLT